MLAAAILISAVLGDPLEFEVTSKLGELDDAVREQVTTRVETLASSLDHQPVDAADHKLTINIEWAAESETDFHVTLRSSLGEDAAETQSFECRECNAAELLDRTEAHARTAIEQLFDSIEDEAQDVPTSATPPPPQTPPASPSRKKIGRLGWAGVGSLGLGASGLIAGGVLLSLGEARLKSDPTSLRDFRPAGYAALGVGGAALIVGTVLLVLDRKRARTGATALRVTPSGSGLRLGF
ncbi:MAG: hypothetical protein KUG77_07340 [Nannocystaceae bacterium]|nr:hypothetical protein [Nannocystaceae bacterium]